MSKKGLGKGLSALIPTETCYDDLYDGINEIDIHLIKPNRFQPRNNFDNENLRELADSINEHGVVQPVVVRKALNGTYELVVGERRFRACQILGLKRIPAVLKEYNDQEMMEVAIIENIQRQDLNPVEEAIAYKRLLTEFKLTQEEVAKKLGKSRPFVANIIRLLNLPNNILNQLESSVISTGHARALLGLNSPEIQESVCEIVINKNLNVRETEKLVKKVQSEKAKENNQNTFKINTKNEVIYPEIESRLRSMFGTKVLIKNNGTKGKIEIEYYNTEDLERIIDRLIKEDF